jgi:NAD(P)-dependent dehydrogenase (short-subunit alcohol dehydrogenase family)
MAARTWLIAGVSSGFGRELSTQLLDHGDHVVGTIGEPSKVTDLIPIVRYEILVEGNLDDYWSAWFYGLHVSGDADVGTTRIAGPLPDQAALHGLLAKIRDLGLPLLEVRRTGCDRR